jgi:hypothetical protein
MVIEEKTPTHQLDSELLVAELTGHRGENTNTPA